MDNCTIDGCARTKRSASAAYCEMHYYRVRRAGSPGEASARRNPRRGECRHNTCSRRDDGAHGWCKMHAERVRKHGNPDTVLKAAPTPQDLHPQWKGDAVSYSGIHMRLRTIRGAASEHACVDCGERAAHWSYDHLDPEERQSREGAYSVEADHYQPRCVPCHKMYDLDIA